MKKQGWTDSEKELLKKSYSTSNWEGLKKLFSGRSRNAIRLMAREIGLKRDTAVTRENSWLSKEEELIKKMYSDPAVSWEEIVKAIPRHTKSAIQMRATNSLKLSREGPKVKQESLPVEDPQVQVSERMKHLFGEETLKPAKLPQMRAEKPFLIVSEKEEILILNSMLIGSLSANDDKEDIIRNALRLAKVAGYGAVLLSGDLMYMLTQRYGTERPYKTQVSGVRVDPKKVQEAYPKAVVSDKKFESVDKRLEKGDPVFMTLKLRLEHNTAMLNKVFTDENGKPLFSGPVYITFGKLEDELIMFYANELLRVGLFGSRTWAQKRVYEYIADWRKEKDPAKKKEIYQKLRDFKEWLNIFAVMSNMADESIDKAREKVTGYLIEKYEECIPNSKVISVGDAFLKTGPNSIMTTTVKGREAGAKLSVLLASQTESYSKGRQTTNIPNVMLGTGLNPYLDIKFVTYQASGEPGDKRMCMILQLPMCIDSERYRDVIRNQNILKDDITKVGQKGGFESGAIALKWCDCLAPPIVKYWTSELLKNKQIFKDEDSIRDMVNAKQKENRIIFGHKEGCSHYGANDVLLYDSPEDSRGLVKKYHHQVTKEYLLACDAPILHHQHDGDATQQANHDYQKNVHLESLLPEEMQKKYQEIMKDSKLSENQKLKELVRIGLEQKVRDGVLDLNAQIEGYVLSLEPYLEYFVKVLRRSMKVNLSFEGLFSVITQIAGNHNKNTFKHVPFYVSDAKFITIALREAMLFYVIKKNQLDLADVVRKEITSPQNGPLGEGRGALCVDGKRCYAMVLKHKQGSMDKTQERTKRRGSEHYEVGLPICNLSGDDHKGGVRVTRGVVHIKTGCQQGEGSFGRELDFSEQNVFSMVYGIPVGGFANGPLVFMALDYQTMRRYALKPFAIHREKLFKNALE